MYQQLTEKLLNIGINKLSILGTIFAVFAIIDIRNWVFRAFLLFILGVMDMLIGIREIEYRNRKTLGYTVIIISISLFCVMAFTIYVSFKRGIF